MKIFLIFSTLVAALYASSDVEVNEILNFLEESQKDPASWSDDVAIVESGDGPTRFWNILKKIPMTRKCECPEKHVCMCCAIFDVMDNSIPSCIRATYTPNDSKMTLSVVVQSNELISKTFDDSGYCMDVSVPLIKTDGKLCFGFYATEMEEENFITCVQSNFQFLEKKLVKAEFGCFGYQGGKFVTFQDPPKDKTPDAIFTLNVPKIYRSIKEWLKDKLGK